MPCVDRVLVVGAGVAGLAAAVLLAEAGIGVDLVEVRADPTSAGSGITLQRNAVGVLRRLGVLEEVLAAGFPFGGLGIRSADGTLLAEFEDDGDGSGLPATLGLVRPELTRVLLRRARAAGAGLRLGTGVAALAQDGDGVDVAFDDGTSGRYPLVVGADGVRSRVRQLLGIQVRTRATGMGIWRVATPRPAGVVRTDLCYDGPCYIAGFCPTGPGTLYAYLVEDARDRSALDGPARLALVRDLASAYHGPWDGIRAALTDGCETNYTWFETHLLPPPWHRGRVVLIGDAVHVFPPTVAQGAAMALEDAQVLAEFVVGAPALGPDLLGAFAARRFDRVKVVSDASVQLGQWLLDGVRGDLPGLMGRVAGVVSRPA